MRLFTPKENRIIEQIVDIFREAKPGSLPELEIARLLREQLKFFAIKWSIDPIDEVIIYVSEGDFENSKKIDKQYFEIADFIYFIEELEQLGFIKLQKLPSKNSEDYTILYNKKKYKYHPETDRFSTDVIVSNGDKEIKGVGLVAMKQWNKINTDFAKDLQRCASSIVYPLPLARDYVDNDFKTLEQRQFEKQMDTALDAAESARQSAESGRKSANFAIYSFIIALIALAVSIYYSRRPTHIDSEDLNKIESAINSNHLSQPLEIITNDTLVVNQVQAPNLTTKETK